MTKAFEQDLWKKHYPNWYKELFLILILQFQIKHSVRERLKKY